MRSADEVENVICHLQVPLVLSVDVLVSLSDGFELSSSNFADSRCFLSSSTCPKTVDMRFRLFTLLDLDRKPFAIVVHLNAAHSWMSEGLEVVDDRLRCV